MPAEQWSIMPPETITALLYGSFGSGSLVTAVSQWTTLATQFEAAKNSFSQIATTMLAGWTGPAAHMLDMAAQAYQPQFDMMATYAGTVAVQLGTVAGLFETAKAAAVPLPVIAANRTALATLIATNFLGQNTAAIAETELLYEEMRLQNSAAMTAYETGWEASVASVGPQLGGIATAMQVPVSAAELGAGAVDEEFFDALEATEDVLDGVTVAGLDAASLGTQAATQGFVGTAAPGAQGLVGTAAPGVEGLVGTAAGVESLGSSAASTLASYGETAVSTGGSMTGNLAPAVMSMAQTGMGSSTTGWSATAAGLGDDVPLAAGQSLAETPVWGGAGLSGSARTATAALGQSRLAGALSVPQSFPGAMSRTASSSLVPGMAGHPGVAAEEAGVRGGPMPMAPPMTPMPMRGGEPGGGGMPGRGGKGPNVSSGRDSRTRVIPMMG